MMCVNISSVKSNCTWRNTNDEARSYIDPGLKYLHICIRPNLSPRIFTCMSIIRVSVEEFLSLAQHHPILDVRSPAEYHHACIPGALSLPLFSDEERKTVGTAYKQVSREEAIKIGLDFFGPKMRKMVEFVETTLQTGKEKTVLIHCWRGGMRSGAIAWLMNLYGFEVVLLDGGYKAFRNWVLAQFRKDYPFRLVGGYTGSGKTQVLHELSVQGHEIIDLEAMACHKGSAFGGLDKVPQPSTEMFENTLAYQLFEIKRRSQDADIWIEDESQRIGDINMPIELWNCFRTKPLYFLAVDFENRLEYIVQEYGKYSKEGLINAIVRIRKRLGGLETKTAVNCLLENDLRGCFSILLRYYDKHYEKALKNRPNLNAVMCKVDAAVVDPKTNTKKILAKAYESTRNEHSTH